MSLTPYIIDVPQNKFERILRRVREFPLPETTVDSSWAQGPDWHWLRDLCRYWLEIHEWRATEARFNALPHFGTSRGAGPAFSPLPLAVIVGGTRKAAEFLSDKGPDQLVSPTIYTLQIMQSGQHTCMVHRRSTVKKLEKGDPDYFSFCGIANFKQFKLGFDREFFLGSVTGSQARLYETAVKAQQAALSMIRPGAIAEDVHACAEEVYRSAGFEPGYRTGRGIGYSFLEQPQLKRNDKTRIQAGTTFAGDGGITVPGDFGGRIGDSTVVTDHGFEYLTEYPRDLTIV